MDFNMIFPVYITGWYGYMQIYTNYSLPGLPALLCPARACPALRWPAHHLPWPRPALPNHAQHPGPPALPP